MRKALMLEAEIKLVFPYNSHIIQQKNLLTLLSNSSKISVYLISLLLLPWLIPHHLLPVRGVCNFLGSVSPQQRFETADQCYSSVLFGKQRKIHLQGMKVGRPKRITGLNSGSSF